jgi:hypothetical protein
MNAQGGTEWMLTPTLYDLLAIYLSALGNPV